MARAETLIGEINRGADFDAVAQQFSAAPSASQGGDLSWLSPGDMRPEIEAAVMKARRRRRPCCRRSKAKAGSTSSPSLGKREPSAPDAVSLDLVQVVARGEGAAEKISQVKSKAKTCGEVRAATTGIDGVTAEPMSGIALQQVADAYRPVLQGLEAGQSSDAFDLADNAGKMVFYVCKRASGDPALPSRNEIYERLFDAEMALVAERYLRDLKREATIDRR